MVLIGDMRKKAEAFAISSKLKGLAQVVLKSSEGKSLNDAMKLEYVTQEDFEWISAILGQVDFNGPNYPHPNPEIVMLATSLRPRFIGKAISGNFPISFFDTASEYFAGKVKMKTEGQRTLYQVLNGVSDAILSELQPHPVCDPD